MSEPARVSFETAKILNGLGFNVPVLKYWNGIGEYFRTNADYLDWNQTPRFISIPEHYQVIDWFLANHNIWIYAERGRNPSNFFPVIDTGEKEISFKHYPPMWGETQQQAISLAITHTLENLI